MSDHRELQRMLIEKLRALQEAQIRRSDLKSWAEGVSLDPSEDRGPQCVVPMVLDCLRELESVSPENEAWVRDRDLHAYLDLLTNGSVPTVHHEHVADLNLPSSKLLARSGSRSWRFVQPGLRWCEATRFALTGGDSWAAAQWQLQGEQGVSIWIPALESRHGYESALVGLFETLAIDLDDVLWLHETVDPSRLPTWTLWRQDDNGNKSPVHRFTGQEKALRAQEEMEATGHKQTFWVQREE